MRITRREVCEALAVLLLVQGCGGGDVDDTPPRSGSCGAAGANISLNHGHVLRIISSDLNSIVDMTYSISGSSDHDHTVTLSVPQLQQLKAGGSVTATTSVSAAHSHVVTVTCTP